MNDSKKLKGERKGCLLKERREEKPFLLSSHSQNAARDNREASSPSSPT